MVKFASHRFQGIAGRSNNESSRGGQVSNVEVMNSARRELPFDILRFEILRFCGSLFCLAEFHISNYRILTPDLLLLGAISGNHPVNLH